MQRSILFVILMCLCGSVYAKSYSADAVELKDYIPTVVSPTTDQLYIKTGI